MNMQTGTATDQIRTELRRHARRASDTIEGLQNDALRRGRRGLRWADYVAHEHPWETAGAAFATGVVLGTLAAACALRR